MKPLPRYSAFHMQPYNAIICVHVNMTTAEVERWHSRGPTEASAAKAIVEKARVWEARTKEGSTGLSCPIGPNQAIFLEFFPQTPITNLGILVHEVQHAVSDRLRYVGIEHTAETEEVFAYHYEHALMTFVLDLMPWFDWRKLKKIKPARKARA